LFVILSFKYEDWELCFIFVAATPDGIAIDSTNRLLFYTDYGNELIASMNLDGTNLHNVTTTDVHNPRGITLDTANK